MRKKYNIFNVDKINQKTIQIALDLKSELETYNEVPVDYAGTYIPVDKSKFLDFLSCKFLNLHPEIGVPLLKQAFKKQFKIEDEYKICGHCGKLFRFQRKSKVFCSDRCRQRNKRNPKMGKNKSLVSR